MQIIAVHDRANPLTEQAREQELEIIGSKVWQFSLFLAQMAYPSHLVQSHDCTSSPKSSSRGFESSKRPITFVSHRPGCRASPKDI